MYSTSGLIRTGLLACLPLGLFAASASDVFGQQLNREAEITVAPFVGPDSRDLTSEPRRQKGAGAELPVLLIEGVLTIMGSDTGERVHIYAASDATTKSWLTVSMSFEKQDGSYSYFYSISYPLDEVTHVFAMLGGGNDTLVNVSPIDSTIYGGAGNDVLVGGWSDDAIYGESGGDAIFGGPGADYIEGGAQSDVICGGWPFSDASGVSLFDPDTLAFLPANLDTEWVSKGYHADHATDTLRGGPENPALDADWFLLEVSPDAQGNALEMDVVVDFANNFDWATFNDHYWKE